MILFFAVAALFSGIVIDKIGEQRGLNLVFMRGFGLYHARAIAAIFMGLSAAGYAILA